MVKKVCNGIKLYWSGWKYTTHTHTHTHTHTQHTHTQKLLAYGYLNNLNKLGRYCVTHLKVVKSLSHNSTQVQGCTITCM